MAGRRGVKSVKKSSVPGVTITQFVEDIPKGCSTPDFERKPITLTLQEGKNAIFRAVVKGDPKPEVVWKCNNKDIDDPQKYQINFTPGTNEFILQINKITSDDADLYRCTAVNEYGEAKCTAGLKIIQVGFKKKTKEAPSARQEDLKKEIQDFRKTLKKRAPQSLHKKEIDMEQVWQLLLNADKKDYERICLKYGVVDFRGMLRTLQEMKKEREDKQAKYISILTNLRHVKVNEEQGNASFDLEMELKHPESRIYLYKDGQMINYAFDSDNVKHCLKHVGKKLNFIINNLQLEDAGVYQIKVEDVDVFSTELEAESIPLSFRYPLGEVRCHEQGDAVLQCTVYDPCFSAVWLHKNVRLEPNDKYDISVSEDGLVHRLLIKNTQLSDKGAYTVDIGSRSSSAWLEVESAKGKRKQVEGDRDDKAGWKSKQLEQDGAKKLRQREGHEDQDSLLGFSMGKDGQYRDGQDGSGEFCGAWGKDGVLGKEGKMGQFSGARRNIAEDNKFSGSAGNSSGFMGLDQNTALGGSGVSGGPGGLAGMGSLYGKDAMLGGVSSGAGFGGVGELHALQGQGSMLNGAGISGAGADIGGPAGMLRDDRGFHDKDSVKGSRGTLSAGASDGCHDNDDMLVESGGTVAGGGLYREGGMQNGARSGQLGGAGGFYGKDGSLADASAGGPGGTGGIGELYGKDGMVAGTGGLGCARGIEGLYGEDGKLPATGTGGIHSDESTGGVYNKGGLLAGTGAGGPGVAGDIGRLYGKNGVLGGAGTGGAGGKGGLYGKDGMPVGVGVGGPGGAGGMAGFYGKDGILLGAW